MPALDGRGSGFPCVRFFRSVVQADTLVYQYTSGGDALFTTVADAVADLLAGAGIRRAYTVPGESYLGLLSAIDAHPRISLVSTRHESGAAFMAEAEGKLTGAPAIAAASRGPGAANLAIGVHTAREDHTPLVAILGQVESGVRGMGAFQEVDLAALFNPIAKWAVEATRASDVPGLIAEALRCAVTGPPGPAVVAVPADFWADTVEVTASENGAVARPITRQPDDAALSRLWQLLDGARSPVAIVGAGAQHAGRSLIDAVERLGLGVYSAFRRQDVFPEDHPNYLGHLGLGVPGAVRAALDEADVVVLLGARIDAVTSSDFHYPLPHQQVVVVGAGAEPPRGAPGALLIDSAVADVLAAVSRKGTPQPRDWSHARERLAEFTASTATRTTHGVHPTSVVRALRRLAPDDTVVTNDAGNFAGFLHRHWCFSSPHSQLAPANGAMGYGVPAAVAAKLVCPDRTVVAMVGDGGLLMTGQEIETAVRHAAPIVVLAYQNGMYGTIAMHQARTGRLAGVDIGQLDLAQWARGLGAEGLVLERPDDIDGVLLRALGCGVPCVVDVRTDPDVITPNGRLSEMLYDAATRTKSLPTKETASNATKGTAR
ncbi:MAG: acetolactate synthase [Pseudonocardiaceae bacterium]|nr:acetolactate synthase [Pseudonocardiaceae bacterium]